MFPYCVAKFELKATLVPGSLRMTVDKEPGKIHFIVPRFFEKNRMRSEAQRMLPIKNNAITDCSFIMLKHA